MNAFNIGVYSGVYDFSSWGISMLTDKAIKTAKYQEKGRNKLYERGLYLVITKANSKIWRFKYTFAKKEKLLTFGSYPQISLADARKARDEAKEDIAKGIDPGIAKLQQKYFQSIQQENTFENIVNRWWDLNRDRWTKRHANDVMTSLRKNIIPHIGHLVIHDINTPLIYGLLQKIENKGSIETAHRIRQRIESVFNYAISIGIYKENNPAYLVKGSLKKVVRKRKQPAITNLESLKEMLNKIELEPGRPITKLAIRLLSIVFVRPGELRGMRWDEIDGDVWSIPSQRMKMKKGHRVFLSSQAREILNEVKNFSGNSPYVFPGDRSILKPMSENAMGYLINRAGYKDIHTPHGFRASFSSIMNEKYPEDRSIIDMMLAHSPKNMVEAAYNRAEHSERRKQLYQIWADLLFDGLRPVRELTMMPRR